VSDTRGVRVVRVDCGVWCVVGCGGAGRCCVFCVLLALVLRVALRVALRVCVRELQMMLSGVMSLGSTYYYRICLAGIK